MQITHYCTASRPLCASPGGPACRPHGARRAAHHPHARTRHSPMPLTHTTHNNDNVRGAQVVGSA
eukprot:scaffold7314_cov141-Isochrysis_galbana.AAC.3